MQVDEVEAVVMHASDVAMLASDGPSDEKAWGDVSDIELPIDLVSKAWLEEMTHTKGNIFRVGKKSEA